MADFRRRSLRLRNFDYSRSGAYFVTICVNHHACLFGEIIDSRMHLNPAGRAVLNRWEDIPGRFADVEVDEVVIMPNHLHGILLVNALAGDFVGATQRELLGKYMQWFKSITTHDYMEGVKHDQWPPFDNRLWHRNYYEHIVRNDNDLQRIRLYIAANPSRWDSDDENPVRMRDTP